MCMSKYYHLRSHLCHFPREKAATGLLGSIKMTPRWAVGKEDIGVWRDIGGGFVAVSGILEGGKRVMWREGDQYMVMVRSRSPFSFPKAKASRVAGSLLGMAWISRGKESKSMTKSNWSLRRLALALPLDGHRVCPYPTLDVVQKRCLARAFCSWFIKMQNDA